MNKYIMDNLDWKYGQSNFRFWKTVIIEIIISLIRKWKNST